MGSAPRRAGAPSPPKPDEEKEPITLESRKQRRLLTLLALAGLAAALLSVFEARLPALAELCGWMGGGCRDTAAFTLLGVPVSLLGVVYYGILLSALFFLPSWAFRVIMAGAGVELTFVAAMVGLRIFCPFCLLNLLVVTALVACVFRASRGWEAATFVLLFLILSLIPFARENAPGVIRPSSGEPDVVARVADEAVFAGELERSMASKLYDARMSLHVKKMEELDRIIEDRLLRLEARRLSTTPEQMRSRAQEQADPVRSEDIQAFLKDNPGIWSSWEGTVEALREKVRTFLEKRREAEALGGYVRGLRERYGVEVLLREPPLPMTRVPLGNSPAQGPEDAPVTVVEFSDYTCPACREAHEITMEIRAAYRGSVRWVFKDFPLERHEGARLQAEAARCARDQGLFWEYQDMLFLTPGDKDTRRLVELAVEMGMEGERFEGCLRSGRHRDDVQADIRAAEEAGVEVTPTFIVNGRLRPGTPRLEAFRAWIEAELARAEPPERTP